MNVVRELITVLGFDVNKQGIREYDAEVKKVGNTVDGLAPKFRGVNDAVVGLRATIAGLFAAWGVDKFLAAGDDMIATQQKLKFALDGNAELANDYYEKLYGLARETGVAVSEGASAFSRFAIAARSANLPIESALKLTSGLQKAAILGGQSAQEAAATALQLGQGLSADKLNGDEFRSFMENAAPLAERVAKALNTDMKGLREMSTAGKLNAKIVMPALLKGLDDFEKAFAEMPKTARLGFSILSVTVTRFLADLNKLIGASTTVGNALYAISNGVEWLRTLLVQIPKVIQELGGLQDMAINLGLALSVAFGPRILALMGEAAAWAARLGVAMAIPAAKAALIVAALGALYLIFDDLRAYARGEGSIFGLIVKYMNELAETNPYIAVMVNTFQNIKDKITDLISELLVFKNNLVAIANETLAMLKTALEGTLGSQFMSELARALGIIPDSFKQMASQSIANLLPLKLMLDSILTVVRFINNRRAGMSLMDAGSKAMADTYGEDPGTTAARPGTAAFPPADPDAPGVLSRLWSGLRDKLVGYQNWARAQNGFPPVGTPSSIATPSAMFGNTATNNNTVNQSNNPQYNFTINVPNGDPATIREAVRSGAADANASFFGDMDQIGRAFGVSMPRTENAAQ